MKIELVEWVDITTHSRTPASEQTPISFITVGIFMGKFIHKKKTFLKYATTQILESKDPEGNETIVIPEGCIVKRRRLK